MKKFKNVFFPTLFLVVIFYLFFGVNECWLEKGDAVSFQKIKGEIRTVIKGWSRDGICIAGITWEDGTHSTQPSWKLEKES